ncbi:replication-relaxation family protein [Alkalibacillus haloalkaliphilus]|uniref:Replication-relaxation n=1 Tax=Alkalibacillus haloalkaliphilus TaxID=94136 RepID=A0A511W7Q2_9BACI|nr:replication-relaxation family protein [Alkalibacillus haloalkaliphilus]GEN46751.1 hypothetical protein AHA02nite_25270 [Alkalibacillus haloalkaliphilus]
MFDLVPDYYEKLDDKRIEIMDDLTRFRALTKEQIHRKHFDGKGYHVNNILSELRKKGYVKSDTLKGSRVGKRGYSYYKITDKGIDLLYAYGKEYLTEVKEPYLRNNQLKYILSANEVLLHLEEAGWQALDSRAVKSKYELDRRDNILGELVTPNEENYGIYILEQNSDIRTIGRIQSEIVANSNNISNYMIFVKGEQSYNKFIDSGVRTQLHTAYKVKLIPYKVGVQIMSAFPNEEEWVKTLGEKFNFDVLTTKRQENGSTSQSFPYLIRHNGQEKYLVDMSFSDLSLSHKVNAYVESEYRWEKRPLFITYMMEQSIYMIGNKAQQITEKQQISIEDYSNIIGENKPNVIQV